MYTRAYDCPNCGAAVPFPSAIVVFAVCGFCRSNVIRRDADAGSSTWASKPNFRRT